MSGIFPILSGDTTVGTASVEKQGLYYRFVCNCKFTDTGVYAISVRCGDHTERLGVCVPDGMQFKLIKRVPVNHFPQSEMLFAAVKKDAVSTEHFIALKTGGKFSHFADITDARFCCVDYKTGIILCSKSCCPTTEDFAHQ